MSFITANKDVSWDDVKKSLFWLLLHEISFLRYGMIEQHLAQGNFFLSLRIEENKRMDAG